MGIVSIAGLAGRGVRVPVPQRSVPKEREPISKSIFKHNGMFTSPFTVFSQKVDMGSGFRVLRNGNPHDVSRSGFVGTRYPYPLSVKRQ